MAADSLVARHRAMPEGGWAWRSAIQAPHYQTDRDVGAASIGEGLLAAYAVTHDPRYQRAAVAAGDLPAGRGRARGGRPAVARLGGSERAALDDALHELRRRRRRDQRLPLEAVRRHARAALPRRARWRACAGWSRRPKGPTARRSSCTWRWTDDPSWRVAYNGVGMGQAGIVLALDAFADRTGDPTFRAYARAGAARLRHAHRRRRAPAAAWLRGRDRRDRLPLRLGRRGLHVPRALPRDRDPRDLVDRAPAAATG